MLNQVSPTTRRSSHQAALVLSRAFVDDPVTIAVYRNLSPDRRVKALIVDFMAELSVCARRGCPVQVNDGQNIIGAAVIYPPGAYPLPAVDQGLLLIKSLLGNGFYDIFSWMKWLREVDELHPSDRHYYLEYIGVEPANQGKGVGSAILQFLISKADIEGVGCYLENTNSRNIALYQRFGFQITCEKLIIGLPCWLMWRPPAK